MRKVNFTPFSIGGQMNVDLLQFLQNANADVFNWLGSALTKNAGNNVVKISGCQITQDSPPNFSINAGIVFFQGEFFQVDAFSGTASGAEVPVLVDDFASFDGPSQTFADGNDYDVLNNRKLKWEFDASGNGYVDYNKLFYTILDFSMPVGAGCHWFRAISDIPANWRPADGTGVPAGTPGPFAETTLPDLRGYTLVTGFGAPGSQVSRGGAVKQGIGETGGAAEHTLNQAETPLKNHNHSMINGDFIVRQPGSFSQATEATATGRIVGSSTHPPQKVTLGTQNKQDASAVAHNNLQPYYVAPFVIRIW